MNAKLLSVWLSLCTCAFAQSYSASTFATFPPYKNGPTLPGGGLLIDSAGNLYGSAVNDVNSNDGAIFKVSPEGELTVIYSFPGGTDGNGPSGLFRDSAGNFYGTTFLGGTSGGGVVFKISPDGKETVLHNFPGSQFLTYPVLVDATGDIYGYNWGTASDRGDGFLYEVTSKGKYSVLHTFCASGDCSDGSEPSGRPIIDKAGNLYGVTTYGGASGDGAVFKLTPKHEYSVLYSFNGVNDAGGPDGSLIQDSEGLMYGCAGGNEVGSNGAIFSITTDGTFSIIYSFTGGEDGFNPVCPMILDSAGNLYGVTYNGTATGASSPEFKITPKGEDTTIYTAGSGGAGPGLAMDKAGNIYGESYFGGSKGEGTIYKLTKK